MGVRVTRIQQQNRFKRFIVLQLLIMMAIGLIIFYSNSINNTTSEYKDQVENKGNVIKAADNFNQ
ncbi:hypothetical protein CIB95_12245 [Lottiidibacillus patelloidae]|uniref:Uncharacterized protein n=1 Tax=Lottiidibacillus patelloidae TaxID=2670334 RepID=A0A263BS59_9BACI|nr:hypothetical protein [Lottiidibacillus patelloidae]OZM56535.1 hypothetical protein CIB95_12245 [Lottiidibacillus patelloidae]